MARPEASTVRCAIYTRKSTEEGLDQAFNTLDAQRESAEAYIASQVGEGWVCVPDRYDDGGFTGGNLDRPALRRLMGDIEAGRIDCIVVYKVDRLSRSLLDFARIMGTLDQHEVSFVSVTQQFNTTCSMGRLTLNVLLSFAQFEREIISERTRDKIAATRRKGKWSGGKPMLGYDVDPNGGRLIVNEDEAARVRAIFDLYLEHESLAATARALMDRGWTNKRWLTKKGHISGGGPLDKTCLHRLLTAVVYLGKITYGDEVHDAEHPAVIDQDTFGRVQRLLKRNGATRGALVRNRFGALLKGLLRCAPCGSAMVHSFTTRNGSKRYRYYVCAKAQKLGWHTCPSKSVPAAEIEKFVIDQVRSVGRDPAILRETLAAARAEARKLTAALKQEQRALTRELRGYHAELHGLAGTENAAAQMAAIQDRVRVAEQRATVVEEELIAIGKKEVSAGEVAQALARFDPVWDNLSVREQIRLLQLLVERVDYDGSDGTVSVTFHPTGIETLGHDHEEREPCPAA